ncbi:hypothetical protein SDC9_205371 [bioreactor metagenome]|uniref:Uncharacterized protein n=1 Tax=bioreactor metagenome TaxID=1076179 RepID=A0A645J2N8_9ZZZZ
MGVHPEPEQQKQRGNADMMTRDVDKRAEHCKEYIGNQQQRRGVPVAGKINQRSPEEQPKNDPADQQRHVELEVRKQHDVPGKAVVEACVRGQYQRGIQQPNGKAVLCSNAGGCVGVRRG